MTYPSLGGLLRIAIDVTAACAARPTGIGRYTAQLARSLVSSGADVELGTRCSHLRHRQYRLEIEGAPGFWIQEPWWPPLKKPDVVHVTDSRVPRWRAPRVATLHDVMHLLPEYSGTEAISTARFRDRKIAAYMAVASECDQIIAVSETTRRHFLEHVDCAEEKVVTVHHGVDPIFQPVLPERCEQVLSERGIPTDSILYAGDLSRRKNIPGIIRGFLAADLGDIPLVLAGDLTFGGDELLSLIEEEGKGRVHHVGWLGDDVLPCLYSSARAFLYCTFYEGFGLPILEAMRCGTPVVISDRGAAPEIAAGHAQLCDPEDPQSIARALIQALACDQQKISLATDHASRFSWERCARETLEVYQAASKARLHGENRTAMEVTG